MRYFLTEDSEQVVGEFWRSLFRALQIDVTVICSNGNKNMTSVLEKNLDELLTAEAVWVQYDIRDDRLVDERYRNTCQFLLNLARLNSGIQRLEILCFEDLLLSFAYLLDWCCCGDAEKRKLAEHIRSCLAQDVYYDDGSDLLMKVKKQYHPRNPEKLAKALYRYFTVKTPFEKTLQCYYKDCCYEDFDAPRCAPDSKTGEDKLRTLYQHSEMQRLMKI